MTEILFELSLNIDTKEFSRWFQEKSSNGFVKITSDEYADCKYKEKGILFVFRDSTYKKKIKVVASHHAFDDDGNADAYRFIHRLDKKIRKYFDDEYSLDDFVLSAVSFVLETDLGSDEKVHSYIGVLKRIGKVKKYRLVTRTDSFSKNCFCLLGKSNGIVFRAFAPGDVVKGEFAGTLRTEIRLSNCSAVRKVAECNTSMEQIQEIISEADVIFKKIYCSIVPSGDFYKKRRVVDIINREIEDVRLRRKMVKFVILVAEKKSLLLAQKAMNTRSMGKIMRAFEKIEVSPITIGKREKEQYFKNVLTN